MTRRTSVAIICAVFLGPKAVSKGQMIGTSGLWWPVSMECLLITSIISPMITVNNHLLAYLFINYRTMVANMANKLIF
jgi:hypothetical protein